MHPSPPTNGRPTWLEIDLDAVVHNYRVAAAQGVAAWPVVKAEAYGLGAVAVARALQAAGAPGLCISLVQEARLLRANGITLPLVLFSGFGPGEEGAMGELGLQPFLFSLEDARRLSAAADPAHPVAVHLKVDSGMARLGVPLAEAPAALEALRGMPGLHLVGIASHLACADTPEHPANAAQIAALRGLLEHPAARGLVASLANSAGILAFPEARLDWVRPGIMLYGASPFYPQRRADQDGLAPVVGWRSTVIQLRELPAGTPLGYGHTHTTTRPSRIAWLPVGYGDGYCRCLGNGVGEVLVAGRRAPVVGRVCMDLTAIDLTHVPEARVGSRATLLGRDGEGFIGIEEMAGWCATIPYEVICRLGVRNPRRYRGGGIPPAPACHREEGR